MVKILEIPPSYPPAIGYGISRRVTELSRALADLGHEVHILEGQDDEYPFRGYNDWIQAVLVDLPLQERVVRLWEEKGPFDAVSVHDWSGALVGATAQRLYGRPLVATLHGTEVGRRQGRLGREEEYVVEMERWLCERADRVVVPSDFVYAEVMNVYGVPPARLAVVPDGARAATFAAKVDREEFRGMFAGADDSLVLFAGRLSREKGADLFLAAAKDVARRRPRTRFVAAGGGNLEPVEGVRFTGPLGPVVLGALYQVADLLVVPSRYEAFGISLLEAKLHDLAVVAVGCGGVPDLARALGGILLVSPEDLVDAITATLDSKGRPERDPKPSQERIPAAYRWESAARAMERIFVF